MKIIHIIILVFIFIPITTIIGENSNQVNYYSNNKMLSNAIGVIIDNNINYIKKSINISKGNSLIVLNAFLCRETTDLIMYDVYFSTGSISENEFPSYVRKRKSVYVVVYDENKKKINKKNLPAILFKEYQEGLRNENSWVVMICKSSKKYSIVEKGLVPYWAIKQFKDFSCDYFKNRSKKNSIEQGVVDTAIMNSIIKKY